MASDRIGVRLRLRHGYARFESANRPQEMGLALFHFRVGIEVHRNPQFRCLRKTKIPRHHTKHLAGFATERERLVNNGWIAAKSFLPESVAQHYDLIVSRLLVLEQKCAAEKRLHTQRLKVVSSNSSRS